MGSLRNMAGPNVPRARSPSPDGSLTSGTLAEEQKLALLDMVCNDEELKTGNFLAPQGKQRVARKWQEIAGVLNAMDGARKTAGQWKDTFANLKRRAKTAYMDRLQYLRGTGGGPPPELASMGLSKVYEKCVAIMGVHRIHGNTSVPHPLQLQRERRALGEPQRRGSLVGNSGHTRASPYARGNGGGYTQSRGSDFANSPTSYYNRASPYSSGNGGGRANYSHRGPFPSPLRYGQASSCGMNRPELAYSSDRDHTRDNTFGGNQRRSPRETGDGFGHFSPLHGNTGNFPSPSFSPATRRRQPPSAERNGTQSASVPRMGGSTPLTQSHETQVNNSARRNLFTAQADGEAGTEDVVDGGNRWNALLMKLEGLTDSIIQNSAALQRNADALAANSDSLNTLSRLS